MGGSVLTDRIPTEHEEQRQVVMWFRQTYRPMRIFAIPNGGMRSKATAAKLKVEGVSPGIPDLFIPELKLWIEMKRIKGGRLSPEQKDWINYLASVGYVCFICAGAEDAKIQISDYIKDYKNAT
jgi:hypothetical protein